MKRTSLALSALLAFAAFGGIHGCHAPQKQRDFVFSSLRDR